MSKHIDLTLTEKGLNAMQDFRNKGFALTLTHILTGSGSGEINKHATKLYQQEGKLPITEFSNNLDKSLHLNGVDDREVNYSWREIGILANVRGEDFLFAIFSSTDPNFQIAYKSATTPLLIAIDLKIAEAKSLSIKTANGFSINKASSEILGVVHLQSQAINPPDFYLNSPKADSDFMQKNPDFAVSNAAFNSTLYPLTQQLKAKIDTLDQKLAQLNSLTYEQMLPVGTIISSAVYRGKYFGPEKGGASMWHLCDGSTFDKYQYKELYSLLGEKTTLPDLTSERLFMRSVGPEGEGLLKYQEDMFKSHDHKFEEQGIASSTDAWFNVNGNSSGGRFYYHRITKKTGGEETRPKNLGVAFYIKMF